MNDKKIRTNPRCPFALCKYDVINPPCTVLSRLGSIQATTHYAHNQMTTKNVVLSSCSDSHHVKPLAL